MLTAYRLAARLQRLEAQADDKPTGEGLCALLAFARRHGLAEDQVPLEALTDAQLDAKIVALSGGDHGLSSLLREHLEEKRAQRQAVRPMKPRA